jgi:hypothetical protein
VSTHIGRKLAPLALLALLSGPVDRAFATTAPQTTNPTTSPSSTATSDGITGTDPEPIDPDIVSFILSLLNLA